MKNYKVKKQVLKLFFFLASLFFIELIDLNDEEENISTKLLT